METKDQKATFTFTVQNETSDIHKFAFTYVDNNNKSNKATTYEKSSIKNSKGEYVWYISNLDLTKYTVTIAGVNEKGEEIPGIISKSFEADLSLYAAGRCMVPDISGVSLTFHNTFTTLDWEKTSGAVKYKIYKKNAKGEFVFVDETDKNSYIIQVSEGKVRYDDFSIKAVCQDGAESSNFSPSVRVKTGPGEIAFL